MRKLRCVISGYGRRAAPLLARPGALTYPLDDQENARQEHNRDDNCEVLVWPSHREHLNMIFLIWRSCVAISTSRPLGILLICPPLLNVVQTATLLDMPPVCRNACVGDTNEALASYPGDFKTIEVLIAHSVKNPLQRFPDVLRSDNTEDDRLHFSR